MRLSKMRNQKTTLLATCTKHGSLCTNFSPRGGVDWLQRRKQNVASARFHRRGQKKKVNHYASAFSTNRVNRQIPCSLKRDLVEVSCDWHDNATRFPMIRDSLFARETVNSPLQSLCGVCSALCQHSKKHLSSACELVNMLTVIRTTVQLLLSLD